jgi:hypothetical protein
MHIFSIIYTLATVLCLANYAAADNNRWILSKNSLSNPKLRRQAVDILAEQNRDSKANAWQKAQRLGWNPRGQADGVYFELMLLVNGRPIYYTTQNVNAAISTAADLVRNTAPYNVNGNGFIVGVWDAGGVLQTHQEFDSRVRIMDGTGSHWHSTHVGGTIAASGVNNAALGMAPGATIDSYDWDSADSEMTSSAASYPQEPNKIYLSNHSYGIATGWSIGSYSGSYGYHWFGFWPVREDEGFGQYSSQAADWDSICYSAPYYLPFKSAGNDRGDYAPSNGTTFYYYDDGWKSKQYDSIQSRIVETPRTL